MRTIDFKAVLESMYLDMMEEMYKHLESNNFEWPKDIPFDDEEKADLLVEMIEYFEEKEDFEKCEALQKMKVIE
jgi:hypothetical protein